MIALRFQDTGEIVELSEEQSLALEEISRRKGVSIIDLIVEAITRMSAERSLKKKI
jgi:hypothetical protein